MSTEPESEPEQPPVGGLKGLGIAFKDSFVDWSLKPLRRWLIDEMKGMQKGWVLCIALIGLAALAAYWLTNLLGQRRLAEKDGEIKAVSVDRDDARNELLNIKMDSRETNRQKDEEISRLNNKINSLDQRVTYFETLPNGVLGVASNIVAWQSNGLGNLQELERVITNSLAGYAEKTSAFELFVGDQVLTNGSVVVLNAQREMVIYARNIGMKSAGKSVVNILLGVDFSHVVANGWSPQPQFPRNGVDSHFLTESMFPVAPGVSFVCAPLNFLTNEPLRLVWAYITANSENSGNNSVGVVLDLGDIGHLADSRHNKIESETFSPQDADRSAIIQHGTNQTYAIGVLLKYMPRYDSVVCLATDSRVASDPKQLSGAHGNLLVYIFSGVTPSEVPNLEKMKLTIYYIRDVQNAGAPIRRVSAGVELSTFLLDDAPWHLP